MKLYYTKGACSLAVRILLHELNINCEYESVSHSKQTETGTDFLTINPKGAVPVLLLDNKTLLTENAVIQQYLADTYQAKNLLPPLGEFQRYRVLEWLNFISTDLHKGFGPLFNPNVPDDLKATVFIPALKKYFSFVDSQLIDKDFLIGNQFTIADGYLFVILMWTSHFPIPLQEFPQLQRYFNALKTRDSIVASLKEEDLSV